METIKRIIAVIDPTKDDQNALARSIDLAKKSGASITAFMTVYDFSYEMTTMLSGDEREAMRKAVLKDRELWLKDLVSPYQNININTQVIWHNRPYEAIINTVINDKYDLVIKGTHQHGALKAVIFTPTDWHLVRKCPTPVLFVKDMAWPAHGNILAAVNAVSENAQHLSLNKRIIKDAQFLCELANAKLNLVNAYPATPVNIAIEIPEFNPGLYNESVKKHHIESTNELANEFNLTSDQCFIEEGLPEDVIPDVAKRLNSELVVIGTVGRTGLSAALVGNTAEHVIDSLDCDVLALKPDGYVSPLAES
ncbi:MULTISPECIES: universal stress protein UspE [Pseudoalteromonas]|jgi:universal stress protein E|uniref:Universal stress protein UspE n=1 Tax=Pseudoalteromonas tetraodonis TaxID=43659 RepID=A0ABD4ERV6_9GAMM|nr:MULTISPECIES: universal stress protein UspE [Pseudoalteromonas]KYL35741.1 universal stress protein UspE [Pseudoalteromonas spiralis]MDN3404801.1 universal stress protein UspE [Pseudoalteromonas sp. APC 3218]MDN3407733.1 universal stress protein UspE [Pseudoalteromonas sp. APC 3894]MDN3412750.1 universal stress protein UspE [Pseudoalteromonas sp. APC 3250]MDN3415372.1 universal stress protein UspE [Pseudoalteromonas sp. APC 3227]|tara:strand:+ start:114 stop:1040 length:927 start_codon:yes stop_codon:yes gene_type:complete